MTKKIVFDLKEFQEFLETLVDDNNGTYGFDEATLCLYSAHVGCYVTHLYGTIREEEISLDSINKLLGDPNKYEVIFPDKKEGTWDNKPGPEAQQDLENMVISLYGKEALEKWKKEGGMTASKLMRKIYKQEEEKEMVDRKISLGFEVSRGMKVVLLNAMKDLATGIPIKWDRIVLGNKRINIYGWIPKKDSPHFDFVLLFWDLTQEIMSYVTSSVEFSKKMLINWDGTDVNHSDCIPFIEYFKDV